VKELGLWPLLERMRPAGQEREMIQLLPMLLLLQKSQAGAYIHVYLVLATYALARAFRTWRCDEEQSIIKGRGSSLESFRRKEGAENYNLVVVFDGPHYGIFDLADLTAVLGGYPLSHKTTLPLILPSQRRFTFPSLFSCPRS